MLKSTWKGFAGAGSASPRAIDDYVELISDLINEVGEARRGYGRASWRFATYGR